MYANDFRLYVRAYVLTRRSYRTKSPHDTRDQARIHSNRDHFKVGSMNHAASTPHMPQPLARNDRSLPYTRYTIGPRTKTPFLVNEILEDQPIGRATTGPVFRRERFSAIFKIHEPCRCTSFASFSSSPQLFSRSLALLLPLAILLVAHSRSFLVPPSVPHATLPVLKPPKSQHLWMRATTLLLVLLLPITPLLAANCDVGPVAPTPFATP